MMEEIYHLMLHRNSAIVFLRTFTGDLDIFYEIFWKKVYELPGERWSSAKTVVDLGANIGLATLFFSLRCSGAIVYTMEPEPSNFELLCKNLEKGIIHQTIIPINAAIDKEDGEASIQISNLRYNSRIIAADATFPLINKMSMKALMDKFDIKEIDILKIDIEGTEKRLFEGDIDWLAHVRYLLIEFHSASIKAFCLEVLVSKNFSMHPIKTGNTDTLMFRGVNNDIN